MSERKHDYVPRNAAQFNAFMDNLLDIVNARASGWKIPGDPISLLQERYNIFGDAFTKTQGPHTSGQTLARNEAQVECAKVLRTFVNQYLRFPPITDVDRIDMGIPNHDTIRTDHTVVTETVDYVIHLKNIRELVVDFWVQGTDNKAKPAGYDGAVIIWDMSRDTPPQSEEDLTHHIMASRTPFTLHFKESERGKIVYTGLAWQNERGIMGQWSEFKSAVIP